MTYSIETKAALRNQAKALSIPTVAVSYDKLVERISAQTGDSVEVVLFLANGGSIKEVPGFKGVAPRKVNTTETSAGGKVAAKREPRRIKRTEPTETPKKVNKDGIITLQNICDELGVEGRIARRKLRSSTITKPGTSWEWAADHADIALVKELIG